MNSKNCNAMKKIFTKLMLLAVAATAIVSCENKIDESTPVVELTQTVTLTAEKPADVRTELIGGAPYWSVGDAIGVYLEDNTKHYKFENDAEEATLTTSFTGETAVANTLFVYYPYTSNGVADNGAKVDIPVNQEPTATSFDGKADIMLAKPVQLDAEGKQISDLEFARLGAIVKVVLKDKTGNLAGQHVSALTMTAESNLVGRVYIDVVNQQLGELYYGGSKSVNATYTEATQYEIKDENATYLIVYPQTLAAGTTLKVEAATEGYAISKEISLPEDYVFESGKVATLTVNLFAEHMVAAATGLALPFEDDFSWVGNTSTTAFPSITEKFPTRDDAAMYTAVSTVYPEENTALKFSSGSAVGSLTTAAIDLSQPFSVVVNAKYHNTDASSLVITVGEVTKTIALTADYADYVVEFDAASAKETITISGTAKSKRFYLNDFKVVAGHDYVLPPVLTVSTAEISGVSHEGEAKTFTYSVTNPVEGTTATVTDNVDWITTADNNGTVTVTVAANDAEEAREGVVTVTYGDLTKTVTVKQNAKPAEGSGDVVTNTVTYTVSSKSACTTSGTAPTGSSAAYTQTYSTTEQITANNSATFTLNGYEGATIKGITLNMKSNASKGAGTFSVVAGSTTLASIASATTFNKWYDNTSYGSTFRDIHVTLTNDAYVIKSGESVVVKFEATTNSIYIHSITIDYEIGGGSTPEPEPATPVLSVNPTSLSFDAAAGSKTIACTIENEVSGQNVTATEDVDWLSTSVSGKTVTVTATENTTTSERTATVTIAYTGAESETVTVNQAAGNAGGGTTVKGYKKVTAVTSGKKYIIVGGGTAKAMIPAVDKKMLAADVTITNDVIESNATTDAYAVTFTAFNDGYKIKFVNQSGVTYCIAYGSSTDFSVVTSTTNYWKVVAASTKGTFDITASNGPTRAIMWRTGTTNKFAPYAKTNINNSEYNYVDLYEYQD